MKIYWDIETVERAPNSVVTVGTFDGIHLGHRFIIDNLKKRAAKLAAGTTLVTFDTHPRIVLRPHEAPQVEILTTIEEKIEILREFNLDRLVVIKFTKEFSNTPSGKFVRAILFERIGFKEIVLGHDHGFGKNREGDVSTLRALGAELDFTVTELDAYTHNGGRVSSSQIRDFIANGRMKEAAKLLGRNYFFTGVVVKGEGRGKALSFPTANIQPENEHKLIPGDGVYAVQVELRGQGYKGMMNIGNRPTFDTSRHAVEVHIFDFSDDIYGDELKVEFIEKIREEREFADSSELVKQLHRDQARTLEIL